MRADLDRAAQGLESFFLRQLMKEAIPDLGGNAQFGAMLQDALADELAKSGGLGVSEAMTAQLARAAGVDVSAAGTDPQALAALAPRQAHSHTHEPGTASMSTGPARALRAYGISSGFGTRVDPLTHQHATHAGIDLPATTGTGVRAAFDGVVSRADPDAGGYGQLVVIDHGDGTETRYAHLSAIDVRPGQKVTQGETLGAVGSSGRSTGPHLHFELRRDGQPLDPTTRVDPRVLVTPTARSPR